MLAAEPLNFTKGFDHEKNAMGNDLRSGFFQPGCHRAGPDFDDVKDPVPQAQVRCVDCARVIAVTVSNKKGEASAVGLIAGGLTGAILGHQVGGGRGKDLATVAGAAGGAYAGRRIEENVKTHKVWTIRVQYPDGRKRNFSFKQNPGLMTGDAVRNSRHSIVRV